MTAEMMVDLHCGACGVHFDNGKELLRHLKGCRAARASSLPYLAMVMGAKDPRHLAGHLIYAMPKARDVIVEYAAAIAEEKHSVVRAQVHQRLCERLGLKYYEFRPFESEAITEIPTQAEAEAIIYDAIGELMLREVFPVLKGEKP